MSDQDNLRDRIEEIIWKRTTLPTDTTTLIAQAIIDKLGLTVEGRIDEPGKRGINPVQRIVGKWENHDQHQ